MGVSSVLACFSPWTVWSLPTVESEALGLTIQIPFVSWEICYFSLGLSFLLSLGWGRFTLLASVELALLSRAFPVWAQFGLSLPAFVSRVKAPFSTLTPQVLAAGLTGCSRPSSCGS